MRNRKVLALTAALAAGSLLMAACGSDADNSTAASDTTAAAAADTTAAAPALVDIVDTAVAAGSFTTLAQLLTDAGLVETLKGEGPFTVFAPTDEAFAAVPAETLEALAADKDALVKVLTYHVVPGKVMAADVATGDVATVEGSTVALVAEGGKVTVNGANVVTADVEASNGVIHVIDAVILPEGLEIGAAEEMTEEEAAPATDIVDTAVAAGNFTTLATALQAAGLVDALKGEGPFTVFAPTDEAFAKVPADQLAALLADPAALAKVLTYHVVSGKVMAADVTAGEVPTLEGQNITISIEGGNVKVNDANVIATDMLASNGVIHVIDSVILPPSA
jgi:transforming growth factor-beta-induced protein